MDLLFIGLTARLVGEILVGFAVLNVHRHVAKEHKIDDDVLKALKAERWYAVCGIGFIVIGYFIELNIGGYISVLD